MRVLALGALCLVSSLSFAQDLPALAAVASSNWVLVEESEAKATNRQEAEALLKNTPKCFGSQKTALP